MGSPASVDDFLDLVRKSGLVANDRLESTLAQLNSSESGIDHLASTLVQAGLLTKFQAKQVKLGRYKRFTIAGKYRLLELLGVGGMGAVYLCEHSFMHRLVAVKVLPVDKLASDPTALQRFYREAQAVASLDHPNIVRAFDIDKYETLHFLVMEYVDGSSLQEMIARYSVKKRFFDPVRAVHYIAQAASGLQHAGELGLIHRDIKPGNLLLDRSGTIKILDMGLARFFDHRHDGLTEKFDDKCILGTADYLAPEQATNAPIDIRADIYGLGGTLYFMLTGSSPFPDGSIAQKLLAHQRQEPKPIESFRSDVPEALIAVVSKMMAKKPDERYQTPNEVIDALSPWLETPISPPLESEMPTLCPAVANLAGYSPTGSRTSGSAKSGMMIFRGPKSEAGSRVLPGQELASAMVATAKASATLPYRSVEPHFPLDKPTRPLPNPQEAAQAPRWPLFIGIAMGSFLAALGIFLALFYLLSK
jgi:serine/threonine protein kinase